MLDQKVELLVLVEPFNHYQSAKVRFAVELRRTVLRVSFHFGELRRLGFREFPVYVRSRWNSLKTSLTDLVWSISERFRFLDRQFRTPDLERILFLAANSYEPKPLTCRTIIFSCRDYPLQSAGDPYFGWRELFAGRSEIHEVPGDHLGIFQEPNVQVLAEELRDCLRIASQERASKGDLDVPDILIES
jgi:hypothetical protein